ncbi:MAG TPA: phosphate--AMP phosphotransferase, partial [Lachnoclostridium sp.]|nr:phosphate--AMP phosphotransferase [Lachnoclostridium sp.]
FELKMPETDMPEAFHDIQSFERQLTDDGMVIIKLFLYISKEEQKKRFNRLESSKETSWRVTKEDWRRNKEYGRYLEISEEMLERTDMDYAPWTIIEATDRDFASAKIMTHVADCLEDALKQRELRGERKEKESPVRSEKFQNGVLSGVDLSKTMTKEAYKKEINRLEEKLESLHSQIYRLRIPVVLGFEGWDAAGKGGAIKRLTSHLDPRGYKVYPTSAPNDLERVHHYLWRFWNHVPKAGHIAIFDRTWYGRVLVERIEGFCSEAEWKQAYQEINEMENHLANAGAVVIKFWLHIDKDEQEKRFKEREENPSKQWKITEEDWRNREKWDQYESAVNEMLVRTSTTYAPWVVVEGNCKYYARIKVLKTVVEALEAKIKERTLSGHTYMP